MTLVRYSYPTFRSFSPILNGFARSPWAGLETEIDRLFQTATGDFGRDQSRFPVDLYEDKDNTYVRAELPGFQRDAINVEVVDGTLTITAARKSPNVAGASTTEAQPEESFTLTRSITVNDEVQTDKIAAAYENGVLTVTLPKREETKPRKVTVAVK